MAELAVAVAEEANNRGWSGTDRLGLRVSEMMNSPIAQLRRWVVIHRLDTDSEEAWDAVVRMLVETDGLDVSLNDDGTVGVSWGMPEEVLQAMAHRDRAEACEDA